MLNVLFFLFWINFCQFILSNSNFGFIFVFVVCIECIIKCTVNWFDFVKSKQLFIWQFLFVLIVICMEYSQLVLFYWFETTFHLTIFVCVHCNLYGIQSIGFVLLIWNHFSFDYFCLYLWCFVCSTLKWIGSNNSNALFIWLFCFVCLLCNWFQSGSNWIVALLFRNPTQKKKTENIWLQNWKLNMLFVSFFWSFSLWFDYLWYKQQKTTTKINWIVYFNQVVNNLTKSNHL